ncbi:serine threonine protein kinase [Botrytis cinerea]
MSSAALQTAPHQPTSIGSQSPVAAPSSSGRPYTSGSQQSRDPYYNQSTTNASPSSARKPSRRPSGNGASTNTPPQPQYTSPLVTTTTTAPVNSRTNNPSTQISPTTATSPSSFAPMAPGDHQRGVPPIVSERSSSNRPSTAVAAATSATNRSSSSRRGEHPDEQRARDAPRRAQSQENQYHERRNIQTNGTSHEDATAAATAATRARRRAQQSPEALPHRPSGGREQRAGPPSNAQNRSHPAGTTSPAGLSHEASERMELDKILPGGSRRGDLMQTSCGSPCYAAPELVVSDSLYTGRKVDVWSCGVILYAMLAGYLPFDDDPANPEGDNINLLYKYIVSTPLTFPEYVTPHARDLLRRILVPDPRKRADLFEVARHSWLSEYAHVVGFITSSTTTTVEIANTTVPSDEPQEAPILARSASVREPKSQKAPAAVGDLSRKHGHVDQDGEEAPPKTSKDNKRRTVQVEYVAPRSQTQRGEPSTNSSGAQSGSRTRARAGSQGPVEISGAPQGSRRNVPAGERQSSQDPSMTREAQNAASARRTGSSQRQQGMVPPPRPTRDHRAASDINHTTSVTGQPSIARPTTGGSMTSNRSGSMGFPTRGSYSQPVAPTVAGTNAHGRMSQPQPKSSNSYNISPPMIQGEQTFEYPPQSTSQPIAPKFARVAGLPAGTANNKFALWGKSHAEKSSEKPKKSYPPVSMSNANVINTDDSRQSIDSRRSISFGFGKKRSGSIAGRSQTGSQEKASRRFSLLPASFSLKSIGIGKDPNTPPASTPTDGHYEPYPEMQGDHLDVSQDNRNVSGSTAEYQHADMTYDQNRASPSQQERQRFAQPQQQNPDSRMGGPPQFLPPANFRQDESALTTDSESSFGQSRRGPYQNENNNSYEDSRRPAGRNNGRGVLQKNNRKFADAYDQEHAHNDHGGSSGAARKVMDFFRRRGKARGE